MARTLSLFLTVLKVVSSKNPGSIFWFENNGFQNFKQKTAVSDVYGASGVATADLNSDGRVDILGSSFTDLYFPIFFHCSRVTPMKEFLPRVAHALVVF